MRPGFYSLVLHLNGPPGAVFTTFPIQFAGPDHQPAEMPKCFNVHRESGTRVTITNRNMNLVGGKPECFGFHVLVHYEGKIYASMDPTVVNDPPEDPGEPESE